MRHHDDKSTDRDFDDYFLNVIFSKTITYRVEIWSAHFLYPCGGNRVSDFFVDPSFFYDKNRETF